MTSQTIDAYSSFSSLSSPREVKRPCTDMLHRLPEGNPRVYKSEKVKSDTDTRTHSSPFKDSGRWIIIEKISLTHFGKVSPFSPHYLITLQDLLAFLGTSLWWYMFMCPLAVPSQIYRLTYQWFTWIYLPTTGGAPPWNNILPGTTNAANNYQTCVSILYIQHWHD